MPPSLRRALSYLFGRYKALTAGAFLSLILVTATNLLAPTVLRVVIDRGIAGRHEEVVLWGAAVLVVIALVRGLFTFLQGFWSEKASQGVAYDLRDSLFTKLQGLSFSYHDQAQTGELMTRATNDVELVRQFTGQGFLQLLNALVMLIGSVVILLLTNWRLALVALAVVPLLVIIIVVFFRRVRPMFTEVQQRLSRLNTVLQENIAGIRVVKAFAREPYETQRFARFNGELLEQNLRVITALSSLFPLIFFIANLGTLAIIWVGGLQVIGHTLSVGELVAFNTYLMFLIMPIATLGMLMALLARAGASATRIFEVLDAQSEVVERPGAVPLPAVDGRVAFEDVSFRYIGAERDTLSQVSFTVEPGQTLAVLGATGSGKSTIINLLPRFYDVSGGRITVDGHDIRDVTLASLRSQVGIVLQDTTLFTGSLRSNIAYGLPDASLDDVVAAAKAAQAHDFISALPQGHDTVVGERGVGLSGGQQQRIAIARALLLNPRILILDDSTSSVDAETEYQIQQALRGLMRGRTSFVIAQRISTVREATSILLLDGGRVAAHGSHEQLLQDNELYAQIVASQLRDDPAPVAAPV